MGGRPRTYTVTVTRLVVTGELATDDPAVNFRVTGYGQDWVGLAWEVPRNRGISSYVLQRYQHDGNEFVSFGAAGRIDGETNGGAGHSWGLGSLDPDTLYKYTLMLKNELGMTVMEKSVTVRTHPTSGATLSSDATLSSLTLSGVGEFGPLPFRSSLTNYTATVANSVTETTVMAAVNHSGASYVIKLGGVTDGDAVIPLRVGSNIMAVEVTAEDGIVTKVYTVNVTREGQSSTDATLSSLTLSNIDIGTFDPATTQYSAQAFNLAETTVTVTMNHSGASYVVKIGGVTDDDGVIPLTVGNNVITVEVTAEDGTTTRTYTVTVTRVLSADATLSDLTLSGITLSFHQATTQYTAQVPNSVSQTIAVPTVNYSGATYVIKLGGVADGDGVIPLEVGSNVITVEVTAENGSTTRTYTVTVTRLVVTDELATDNPRVNFRVTGYGQDWVGLAWEVPRNRGISSYVLQRYHHDGNEFVSPGSAGSIGGETNGGAGHSWGLGSLDPDTLYKYTLMLKNELGTTVIEKSITVRTSPTSGATLSTDATLSSLSLSGIDFGTFSPSIANYTASVSNSVSETTVTATVNRSGASFVVKLDGVVDDDGVVPLSVDSNIIAVEVTAEDGIVSRAYAVEVTRAGLPTGIDLSPSGPVEEGSEITVTMSFSDLEVGGSDDLVWRADVFDSEEDDANACEGAGLGIDQTMGAIDEDPEVRTAAISADCAVGDYTVKATLRAGDNVRLAFANADFTFVAPSAETLRQRMMDRYDSDANNVIDRAEVITAIRDYFDGVITKAETIAVIRLYFSPSAG